MKVRHYIKFLLFAGIILFFSCTKDDIDEPNGVKVAFQVKSVLKSSSDTVLIEEAYIGIEEIDFKLEKNPDTVGLEKIVNEGPYAVDLLNRSITPAIRWIFVEPGHYRKIALKTSNVLKGGNSLTIKGTIMPADRSGDIPFEISSTVEHNILIENNDGIEINNGKNINLLIYFDLSYLFSGIDLSSVKHSSNGRLIISDDSNSQLINLLIERFEQFSSFKIDDGSDWEVVEENGQENDKENDDLDESSNEVVKENPGNDITDNETDVGGSGTGKDKGQNDEPTNEDNEENSDDFDDGTDDDGNQSDDDNEEDDGDNEESGNDDDKNDGSGQDDDNYDVEQEEKGSQDDTDEEQDNMGDVNDKGDGEGNDNNSAGPGKGKDNPGKGNGGNSGEGNNGKGKGSGGNSGSGGK